MKPLLYIHRNRDTGLALVRGQDAKILCQTAASAQRETGRPWRVVWNGGWCVPVSAVPDLEEFARSLGRFVVVTDNVPRSRGQSRDASRGTVHVDKTWGQHPGQEMLPL